MEDDGLQKEIIAISLKPEGSLQSFVISAWFKLDQLFTESKCFRRKMDFQGVGAWVVKPSSYSVLRVALLMLQSESRPDIFKAKYISPLSFLFPALTSSGV